MADINTQEAIQEITQITKQLVSFRSTTDNKVEVRKCTDYIKSYFNNTAVIVEELEYNNVLSLYLRLQNSEQAQANSDQSADKQYKSKLLLSGHYDVVEGDDDQFQARVEDGKLFARGAIDMKSGLATGMYLMKKYSESKNRPSIAALLTSDEEIGGSNGAGFWINEKDIKADFCIALEQNDAKNPEHIAVVIASKGILDVKITVKGKAAHGAYLWQGENAIEHAMLLWEEMKNVFPNYNLKNEFNEESRWQTSINIGKFEAGTSLNRVPDTASFYLDIRYTDEESPEQILEKLASISDFDYEVLELKRGTMLHNPEHEAHIEKYIAICEEISHNPVEHIKIFGGSDVRFTSAKGIPSVMMGPWGKNLHAKEEFVLLESIGLLLESLTKYINQECS